MSTPASHHGKRKNDNVDDDENDSHPPTPSKGTKRFKEEAEPVRHPHIFKAEVKGEDGEPEIIDLENDELVIPAHCYLFRSVSKLTEVHQALQLIGLLCRPGVWQLSHDSIMGGSVERGGCDVRSNGYVSLSARSLKNLGEHN